MSNEWETFSSSKKSNIKLKINDVDDMADQKNHDISNQITDQINWEKLASTELWLKFKKLKDSGQLTMKACQQCKKAISKALQCIEDNYIGSEGVRAICESLKVNNSLKKLIIYWNDIDDIDNEVKEMLKSITTQKEGFYISYSYDYN